MWGQSLAIHPTASETTTSPITARMTPNWRMRCIIAARTVRHILRREQRGALQRKGSWPWPLKGISRSMPSARCKVPLTS